MTDAQKWRKEFERALQEHLAREDDHLSPAEEAGLLSAYDLGRRALGSGLGVLDVVSLLHQALLVAVARAPSQSLRVVTGAESFILECLSSFEMAYRGVRDANTALRRLNDVLEEQTRRISHELHDESGQLLASVHLALAELGRELPSEAAPRLDGVRALLDRIEDQLRRLSHELRPTVLDDLGLGPALEFLAEGVSARTGLAITLEGMPEDRLPPRVEAVLYRIVQEALNNVAKHAKASGVKIQVRREEQAIRCSVADDGVGFDVSALRPGATQGIGLIGIRERLVPLGGSVEVTSAPGGGTELFVSIPRDETS
jgi:two-component system, NarL family, sensor histidine kinase UhpB